MNIQDNSELDSNFSWSNNISHTEEPNGYKAMIKMPNITYLMSNQTKETLNKDFFFNMC